MRFARQQAEQQDQNLRDEAGLIADRITKTCLRFGWDVQWSGHGRTSDTFARWSASTLKNVLLKGANVDLASRQKLVIERIDKLRNELIREPINPANAFVPAGASQRAIDLKQRRHELSKELSTLRLQKENTDQLLGSIEHKIKSAHDLLRYKVTNVGRLDVVECPTCHRDLNPDTFSLHKQSEISVAAHIEALKRDRTLVVNNSQGIANAIATTTSELIKIDDNLRIAESALRVITASTGPVREQLAELAVNLAAAEREYERLKDMSSEIDSLQLEIDEWVRKYTGTETAIIGRSDLRNRIDRFSSVLLEYLKALGGVYK